MQSLVPPKVRKVQAIAALVAGAVVSTMLVSGLHSINRHPAPVAQPVLQNSDLLNSTRPEYTASPDTSRLCYELFDERNCSGSQSQFLLIDQFLKTALSGRQTSASLQEAQKLMAPSEWTRFQNIFEIAETRLYFIPTEWRWHRSSVSVNGNLVGMTLEEPFINNMYLTFYLSGTPGKYRIERFRTAVDPLLRKFIAGRTGLKLPTEAIEEHFAAQQELARGSKERAIEHYDRAIKTSPDFFFAYFCRGFERSQLGDHDGAIADYSAAIKLNPRFFSAYLNRSYELNEIKHDFKQAIADSNMAIALESGQIKPYTNKAFAYCELHKYLDAIAACDQAIAAVPNGGAFMGPIYRLRALAESQFPPNAYNH